MRLPEPLRTVAVLAAVLACLLPTVGCGGSKGKKKGGLTIAERIAKANRGRVTNMDANDDQVTEHELHREHMDALALIESMPREQIEAHITRLRSVGFCKDKMPSRVREWPRMAVLAVHAAHQLASKERKS